MHFIGPAGAAQQAAPKKKGAGTKMLDDMRKKGKPITPKLEEMALWLDSMDTSTLDDGQVGPHNPDHSLLPVTVHRIVIHGYYSIDTCTLDDCPPSQPLDPVHVLFLAHVHRECLQGYDCLGTAVGANGEARRCKHGIPLHSKARPHHALHRHPEAGPQHPGHHGADVQDSGPAVSINGLLPGCNLTSGESCIPAE